jgi:putative tryptophan/tyrosine transport system substrate-binding protein
MQFDRVKRREFITLIGGAAAWPLVASAQDARKLRRIGWLGMSTPADADLEGFRQGLRDLGYVEGETILIDTRFAEGKLDRLADLAAELVSRNVEVILSESTVATRAAQRVTSTIPIVMVAGDAWGAGVITNLARPEGNTTGLNLMSSELVGKQFGLLKELIPSMLRVAVLANPANQILGPPQLRAARAAAQSLGLHLQVYEAQEPTEFEATFAAMARDQAEALIVLADVMFIVERKRVAEFAGKARIPAIYGIRDHAEAGGLVAYGFSMPDVCRRAATFVDKILKGAKPSELPIEQPTKFELVINLQTAKALGLSIPEKLIALADEVIE